MKFYNLKENDEQVSFAGAVKQGLGKNQGLFFPETIPVLDNIDELLAMPLVERSVHVLYPFVKDDLTKKQLSDIVTSAFNFPAQIQPINKDPLFCFRVLGLVAFLERTDLVDGTTHARHFLSREFIRALFLKHLSEHPRYERVRKTLSDKGYTNSLDSHEHNWVSMYPRVPQERRRKNRGGAVYLRVYPPKILSCHFPTTGSILRGLALNF